MTVILKDTQDSIPACEMQDGDIGMIVHWNRLHPIFNYVGQIVQRYGSHLITLGQDSAHSWPEYFNNQASGEEHRVRILKSGEILEIIES